MQNQTAFIYAYKTKDASRYGLDPDEVHLAYQVRDASVIHAHHQCDWGRDLTRGMLKHFKEEGGSIALMKTEHDLVLPLHPTSVLVLPVPQKLLQDWELSDLLS